jgi:molecular chaperone DnaK (HSP70)
MAVAVGIDLGITDSVIAATEGGQTTVIPNTEGSRTIRAAARRWRLGGALRAPR